jgi:hypothetical protein
MPWIVMDLLGGEDLDEELHREAFEPERAAQIIADVSSGLAEVHALGIRHRDIKPSNIMVGVDGVPRLIDFGIAREVSKAHLTQAGMVIGTLAYMPPELFDSDDLGSVQDSEKSDVYALGQVLYEMLVGEPAYPREGSQTKIMAIVMREKLSRECFDPREKKPAIPEMLAQVVCDATRQDPAARIDSARLLEKRLRDFLSLRNDVYTAPVQRIDVKNLPPPPSGPIVAKGQPVGRVARAAGGPGATPAPAAARSAEPELPTERVDRAPPPALPPRPAPEIPSAPLPASAFEVPAPEDDAPSGGGSGFFVWLASGVGIVSAVVIIACGTLVALIGLYALRPQPIVVDAATAKATIGPMVTQQLSTTTNCPAYRPTGGPATVNVRFDLVAGWPRDVVVESSDSGTPDFDGCLVQAVQAMVFGGAPDQRVRLPFRVN